ncbi:MAG: HEPN/Toprim-associated domain-containing protein [bacterium]
MGTFSYITFANYPAFSEKNGYYPEIVNLLFQPSDFICERRRYNTRNKIFWGDAYNKESGFFEFKGFVQSVKVCKERLAIFGNSYKSAKKDFSSTKRQYKDEFSYSLSNFKYDDYLLEIKSIIGQEELKNLKFFHIRENLISDELAIYGQNISCLIYSILSILKDDDIVEYDLTDIINDGWVNEDHVKSVNIEKIIVLTEGKTDVEFISKSIEKLFPYLKDYYHFIDFEEYEVKIESSASALVKLVTSFAATKVKHPIIVLFDNDTSGIKEMKKLTSMIIPPNIRVLKYPDIRLANNYPTVGPSGKKKMNVNGYACSIEMYLGVDILTRDDELIPIQWKGYENKEKKYQGEIADKRHVQETFKKKLMSSDLVEMSEMRQLLDRLFRAFI